MLTLAVDTYITIRLSQLQTDNNTEAAVKLTMKGFSLSQRELSQRCVILPRVAAGFAAEPFPKLFRRYASFKCVVAHGLSQLKIAAAAKKKLGGTLLVGTFSAFFYLSSA